MKTGSIRHSLFHSADKIQMFHLLTLDMYSRKPGHIWDFSECSVSSPRNRVARAAEVLGKFLLTCCAFSL